MSLVLKMAVRQPITDADLAQELQDICERNHHDCGPACPIWVDLRPEHGAEDCVYFKDGAKMLVAIRNFYGG